MKAVEVTLEYFNTDPLFKEAVNETLDDRLIYKEGLDLISQSQLFSLYKGDKMIGFYSSDDLGSCTELHLYIYKPYRVHSLSALRFLVRESKTDIVTSVYETHTHISKFLQRLGFKVTGVLSNALVKNGQSYDVVELLYKKDNNNGL